MKIFAYNDKLNVPTEFGSFTVVARKLNEQFKKINVLGNIEDPETFVIYPEVFDTAQRWQRQIPLLACEYSLMPQIVLQKLNSYNPKVLAISDFAKNNIINSGYTNVETVLLGSDPILWRPMDIKKFDTFTYLTVNSSNERSGFEKLIPAFIEFSKDKNVNLIIKDGNNPEFKEYIKSLNNPKIIYMDTIMSQEELCELYNKSHLFIYANNTTSFGMNILDSVLCGIPVIATFGSAVKEFLPEWTQPYKIKTEIKHLNSQSIKNWTDIGIRCFPETFLNLFAGDIYGERVIQEDILNALDFSFINYDMYTIISKQHREFILANYTWEICAKNIIQKLQNHD
jgi:glycosyltransferase involved in cell wall biosynthesis